MEPARSEREITLQHYLTSLATSVSILSSGDARHLVRIARQGLAEAGCEVPPLPGGIVQDLHGAIVNEVRRVA